MTGREPLSVSELNARIKGLIESELIILTEKRELLEKFEV